MATVSWILNRSTMTSGPTASVRMMRIIRVRTCDGTEGNGVPDWGEPDFDFTDNIEIDQVGLTSFYLRDVNDNMSLEKYYWNTEIVPGQFVVKPGFQRDICFSYGCGYVPIRSGQDGAQRYAISCVFAMDQDGIIRNKRTIQVIYDANYNFSKPPRKPVVTCTADDGRVVLDWDDAAERSKGSGVWTGF